MKQIKYLFIIVCGIILVYFVTFRTGRFQNIQGKAFNTYYNIKVRTNHKNPNLPRKIQALLEQINNSMSVFEPDSEINTINELLPGQTKIISSDLSDVLEKSYEIYQLSNGYFDPTVSKLVDLWGFGTQNIKHFPEDADVKEALKQTGFNKVKFTNNYTRVSKEGKININLSAIAKGYAVDKVAELLSKEGYKNYVIEIGGEVRVAGEKSETQKGWNVAIKYPENNNDNAAIITLTDIAVATSGDYRNFFYYKDKRYSHTINPKTGYPVEHKLASVTIFHPNCMTADGLATAVMAMGEDKGMKFINKNNLPAVLFTRNDDGGYDMLVSNAAQKYLEE